MSIKSEVIQFCQTIGSDPLLVQGAGGNVSWKDGDVLWVKASGKWLADADKQEIFVPVDLPALQHALTAADFDVTPRTLFSCGLRPSIETLLHALMPQPVVVHLHPVDILAILVRADTPALLTQLFDDTFAWTWVPYRKPGAALAEAVSAAMENRSLIQVVFLQNHGVVLGGSSIVELETLLYDLIAACKPALRQESLQQDLVTSPLPLDQSNAYSLLADMQLQHLALDPILYRKLSSDWVLYPDHAVFLGQKAICYDDRQRFLQDPLINYAESSRPVFVRDSGVYVTKAFRRAHYVQLCCYYDVLRRQPENVQLKPLTKGEVVDLLNWDAEKYRMSLTEGEGSDKNPL